MSELHELAAPYALNALPEGERRQFEGHLSTCEACQDDVAQLLNSAALVGSAEAVTAPAGLKASVLASIEPGPAEDQVTILTSRMRRYRLAAIGFAAAAAVLALVVAIDVTNLSSAGQRTAILEAGDVTTVTLQGEGIDARFTYSIAEEAGVFVSNTLPGLGEDQVYELWLIGDAGPLPAGLFTPDDDGTSDALVESVMPGVSLGVTVEPAGGSQSPTGEVILVTEIA